MGISMFSSQAKPIAIDFGTAAVKLLQVAPGERPNILAAAELTIPDGIRRDANALFDFYGTHLRKILAKGRFKGKRAVLAIPSAQTFIQHMQLSPVEGVSTEQLVNNELNTRMGCAPGSVVVRAIDVADVHRGGQARKEVSCFAIARGVVMKYIDLLKKLRLETVGVHTEIVAMVRAFDHLNQRESDHEVATMYVDLGWGGTRVGITHGRDIKFARYIQVGGRNFDQLIASSLHCDLASARAHRLSMPNPVPRASRATRRAGEGDASTALLDVAASSAEAAINAERKPGGAATATEAERRHGDVPPELQHAVVAGDGPAHPGNFDLSELLDTISDELSMCLRYHQGLFPGRSIDRVIFLGGEAKQTWLCQHVVRSLRVPAQLGDPLARMTRDGARLTGPISPDEPQPGWAVACGLCSAPTDL
jgi:type IV pilus assembly protein PilM